MFQLRKLAEEFAMAYEADDGPVSNETLTALKVRVSQDRYKTVVSTLFPNEGLAAHRIIAV